MTYFDEDGDKIGYDRDYLSGFGEYYGLGKLSYAPNATRRYRERLGIVGSLQIGDFSLVAHHVRYTQGWPESFSFIMSPTGDESEQCVTFVEGQYRTDLGEKSSFSIKANYDVSSVKYQGQLLPPGMTWGQDINGDGVFEYWPDGSYFDANAHYESVGSEALYQTTAIDKHHLTLGIQCQRNTQRDTHVSTEADLNYFFKLPSGTKFSGRDPGNWLGGEGESEDIWAVLAQDIYEFNQDVDVIVGARYDSYEQAGDAFSPRVAVVWDTFFGQVLKASYGRAFAAPYSSERYFNLSGFKGNPDLKPATIDTYELALQNLMQDRFHYAIVAFHSVLADGFSDDQSAAADTPVFSNSADETFRGVEVEARWLINAQLSIWGNYSHVTAQNAQPGQILGFVEDMGNVGFSVDLAKALSLSSYAHITDDLRDQDTHIDGAVVVHAALVYSGVKNTEISLVARNLLDEEIIYANDLNSALGQPLPPLVGDGRQVLLTVKHSF